MTQRGPSLTDRFTPAWDDQLGDVRTALLATPQWTVEQYRDTGLILPFLRRDQDDYFQINIQCSHRRIPRSAVNVHLHLIPLAASTGNLRIRYGYTFCMLNQEVPAVASWVTNTITVPILDTQQYKSILADLFTMPDPGANDGLSSILCVKIERLGNTDALDTYEGNRGDSGPGKTIGANIGVLYVDGHIVVDRMGSLNESSEG